MAGSQYFVFIAHTVFLIAVGPLAIAEEAVPAAPDSQPGSEILPGLGMSPQAPPVPAAPGGRAPSFGAPTEKSSSTFRLGGRIFGYEAVGIGSTPNPAPPGYSGTALHTPPVFAGKLPYWGGAGATLNLSYGNPNLAAYAMYYFIANGKEYQGYYNPQQGPGFGTAYILASPDPIGTLRLKFKVGYFVDVYGGPGQWGWGVFGPMLALRGLGETTSGDWDLTRDVHITLTHGLLVVLGVPEKYPRGDYNSWMETGVSGWVHHAHLGIDYKNQYNIRLHYASDRGTDERTHVQTSLKGSTHPDGRMDTYLAEFGWQGVPWGHFGATAGLYDFHNATAVGDGVWWAVDWTKGATDMINKYLGAYSNGNGKVAVIGAEYDFSIASILWHPRSFNANAPDIRVAVAGMMTRTVETDDPFYKNATGYFFGLETEYRMTSLFSLTFKSYGESREANLMVPVLEVDDPLPHLTPLSRRWSVYSLNPGIAYRSNWTSLDRIEIIYSRRFYSDAADYNSAKPLDRHTIVLGGYITF
jgi:hypothetical protein